MDRKPDRIAGLKQAGRSWLIGLALLLASAGAGAAADLPQQAPVKAPAFAPIPYFNWTGFYFGINGGGGWGSSSHVDSGNFGIATGNFGVSGGLAGGTVGFNYQSGNMVWGLEGDVDWARIDGTSGTFAPGVNYSSYLQWLSTGRGRVGVALDRFMPYVTGGVAVGGVKGAINGPTATLSGTNTDVGWTVGAGLEYGITPSISLKAEYLYVDLGANSPVPGDSVDMKSHVVRGGLNWRFNWDGPPRY